MRLNAELEQKVEERTLASKENTDARLRFLANMIHEIRNPINSVMLLTGLIEKTPMDSEQCQIYIRRIATATRNGSELINDILDFSKIEALQIPLQQEIFKPAEMFEDLKAMYMKPASQKGLEMRMITPDSTLKVIGDRKRLFQVLSNLVSNATKFTESGHIVHAE